MNSSSNSYVMAIDQGTTGSTVIVLDSQGRVLGKANKEFPQIFPKPGWVEHDPKEIWKSVVEAQKIALKDSGISLNQIAALGITNQRETTILWDKKTGEPVSNAIVWQDRRTFEICQKLKKKGKEKVFQKKTGLVLDPYFSGTKIHWLIKNTPGLKKRCEKGEIAFGTVDSFLIFKLTGGKVHATDPSNASRTLLMNLKTLSWDSELYKILEVPPSILPHIRPSVGEFGKTDCAEFGQGIPITGVAGDQQSALFGQACFTKGDAKCTFGTGSFLLLNTGDKPVASKAGCLTTVAWQIGKKTTYAIEGSAFVCGAAVQWLRDGLKVIAKSSEIEALARSVGDCADVQFVPALTGLGAPYWDAEARGVICGLSRGVTGAHLARATLEGMALQNVGLLRAMQKDLTTKIRQLKVDGGASANGLLMQMQADFLGAQCVRPKMIETTSAGAAYMAGLGAGIWEGFDDIKKIWRVDQTFLPAINKKQRDLRWRLWERAVQKTRGG